MIRRLGLLAFLGLFTVLAVAPTSAIVIPYGDFDGTNVMYLDVTEDTRMSPTALFGAPDISGDKLDFDPLSFTASADSMTGSDITDGQLNFTLMSRLDTFAITNVIIEEAGDYTLVGPPGAFAEATVGALVRFTVLQIDGMDASVPDGMAMMTFTPNASGVFSFPGDAGTTLPWDGYLNLDVAGYLSGLGISGSATKIEFSIDNTLTATAANGGSAFIAKKDFNGVTITIPEPSTLTALLASLLCGLALIRRK